MQTDGPLKVLLQRYPRDLLPLLGDEGSVLQAVENVEIQQLKRSVDGVLRLTRAGEVYYRHVEFQAEPTPDLARCCFEYNAQLLMRYGKTVLTTIVYLFPPGPREALVFRVTLGGREINRWAFQVVRLWEIEATTVLDRGSPGLLALLPLLQGGSDLDLVRRAVRRLEDALPGYPMSEAESVLLYLAGRHYTLEEIAHVVGRDRMIESSVWTGGVNQGRLEAVRDLCVKMIEKHHAALAPAAIPVVRACVDPARLEEWIVSASDLDDEAYARLLSITWR